MSLHALSISSALRHRLRVFERMQEELAAGADMMRIRGMVEHVHLEETGLRMVLANAVPPQLQSFIKDKDVINHLLGHGSSQESISFGQYPGMDNQDQIEAIFSFLEKCWRGCVRCTVISVDTRSVITMGVKWDIF